MGVREQPVRHPIYTPDFDDTVVTVHARFDVRYPSAPRSTSRISTIIWQERCQLEKAEKIDDYMYLVGFKHFDGSVPYITTRAVKRKEWAHCEVSQTIQRGKHNGRADSNLHKWHC